MTGSRRWPLNILITSGMAALIGAGSSYLQQISEGGRTHQRQQCEIAVQFLQDETPSPHIAREASSRISQLAADRFARCLKE